MRSFPVRPSVVLLLGCASALLLPTSASAQQVTPVHVLEVVGPIDRPLLGFVGKELERAEDAGAVVVLQLDTPGAMGEDGIALAERVATLDVPVIAWVGPAPARASGAGLLLMLASSAAAVAPGSQTGPLAPLDVLRPTAVPAELTSRIDGWLEDRGRTVDPTSLAGPLTAQGALDAGIAEASGYTVPEVLGALDGRTVRTSGGEVLLRTRVATTTAEAQERTVAIRFVEPGLVGRVLHAVATPSMVYVLLALGLAALAFEMTQPGFGFAGFSGVGLVALAVYGLTVAIPSWPWFALLVLGVGLLAADVRLRSLSWPTWGGLVAFAVGSWFAWSDADPSVRISPWLIGGAVISSLLYYGFALTVAIQSRDRIIGAQRGLVGLVGEARGRLAPDGPVFVKGTLWRGRSTGDPIEEGTPVRVRGVDGLILRVEAEPASDPEPAGA
ncbi:MAG TPA: NfeD family protein [Actinomycetota bacterium]|nr:NfeD family protein [Actinomycetota bacterium]